jgi:hypothetical protein
VGVSLGSLTDHLEVPDDRIRRFLVQNEGRSVQSGGVPLDSSDRLEHVLDE